MRKLRDGWRAVELLRTFRTPRASWKYDARQDFDAIARYLQPNGGRFSSFFPCPLCGRAFHTIVYDDGTAAAFVNDDDGHACPEVAVTQADLAEWYFDTPALYGAIAKSLRLDGAVVVNDAVSGLAYLGTRAVDGERVQVLLCIQNDARPYCAAANAWLARRTGAGVFLTARACADLIPIFDGKPDALGSLEDLLGVDEDGGFVVEQAFERMVSRVATAGGTRRSEAGGQRSAAEEKQVEKAAQKAAEKVLAGVEPALSFSRLKTKQTANQNLIVAFTRERRKHETDSETFEVLAQLDIATARKTGKSPWLRLSDAKQHLRQAEHDVPLTPSEIAAHAAALARRHRRAIKTLKCRPSKK